MQLVWEQHQSIKRLTNGNKQTKKNKTTILSTTHRCQNRRDTMFNAKHTIYIGIHSFDEMRRRGKTRRQVFGFYSVFLLSLIVIVLFFSHFIYWKTLDRTTDLLIKNNIRHKTGSFFLANEATTTTACHSLESGGVCVCVCAGRVRVSASFIQALKCRFGGPENRHIGPAIRQFSVWDLALDGVRFHTLCGPHRVAQSDFGRCHPK